MTIPANWWARTGGLQSDPRRAGPEIAAEGTWRRLLTDPVSGALLDYGRTTYTPLAGLADFVRARDVYCRNPICRQRAANVDLDHVVAWDDGGTTSEHTCTPAAATITCSRPSHPAGTLISIPTAGSPRCSREHWPHSPVRAAAEARLTLVAGGEMSGKTVSRMRGMASTKITVTVPEELVAHIRREVEQGRYASVSAFVTQAVASMRDFEPLDLLIASMIAETGQPDEAAQAWVQQAMATARRARLAEGGGDAREVA